MSFLSDGSYSSDKRRKKLGSSFDPIAPTIGIRRLSDAEMPFGKKVFLTRNVPNDSASGSLPSGLTGHVPAAGVWEKGDRSDWKAKKLCLVMFLGRGTFQVPISALALG